ncbi:MAG: bifunctional 5,10-methylene-tetrahydrofolate dehydrogenase/5,10-methylene-tetrahydrofolate cyclohydrolase [Flavobacteriales bacterium]|nr:bifunctional 5,10-methylene-tetrahydrofolate dehydrogenase/5,10-methylene-tetrahydrofolate cyclohydrolase [Flavobacteriales bacterium]|tara:strand:+ start:282 stop:1166 length:885 start_codon:yes stop_codon:yes gene_type:complete
MEILDGKKISNIIKNEISHEVSFIKKEHNVVPHLAAILVGNHPASHTYVNAKIKACKEVNFKSTIFHYEDNISEKKLIAEINKLNANSDIHGFIVQLPLPKHINKLNIINHIKPIKDVDGFHPVNFGKLINDDPTFIPATPMGIVELIKRYNIDTIGKHCVVVGRSKIVGLPISILMSKNNNFANCTVTLTHSKTINLKDITKRADILIVALGKANFIDSSMIKKNAVVIDVGITRIKSNLTKSGWKLKGDVNFEDVKNKCSYLTPVPGGVGPMTIVSLLKNTLTATKLKFKNS